MFGVWTFKSFVLLHRQWHGMWAAGQRHVMFTLLDLRHDAQYLRDEKCTSSVETVFPGNLLFRTHCSALVTSEL